ncbi:MAG: tetratricopeptide repeat protein [Alphaproteobacteria bacterium]
MRWIVALLAAAVVAVGLGWLAPAPAVADQSDTRLDALFDRLHQDIAQDEAAALEREIWTIWYHYDSPPIALLMIQGSQAMSTGDFDDALRAFTRVIELAPDFAEGWNRRATLYYLMGRYDDSIADVHATLKLEPRHFGALSGMGLIYAELEDEETAVVWFEKALAVNPHMAGVRYRVELIKRRLAGEPT